MVCSDEADSGCGPVMVGGVSDDPAPTTEPDVKLHPCNVIPPQEPVIIPAGVITGNSI